MAADAAGGEFSDALRIVGISLDCAEPAALAEFYLALLAGHPFCITPFTPLSVAAHGC